MVEHLPSQETAEGSIPSNVYENAKTQPALDNKWLNPARETECRQPRPARPTLLIGSRTVGQPPFRARKVHGRPRVESSSATRDTPPSQKGSHVGDLRLAEWIRRQPVPQAPGNPTECAGTKSVISAFHSQ